MKKWSLLVMTLIMALFFSFSVFADEGSGITMDLLLEQIGKFHPLLLHFPLTIISLLPLIYALTYFNFGKIWLPTIPYFVHFASLTLIPTCFAGLMLAGFGDLSDLIKMHRLLTLLCSSLIILASIYLFIKKNRIEDKVPMPLWTLTVLSFVLLVWGAHLGAESVHGEFLILFQ